MGAECNAAPMRHLHRTSGSHTRTKLMTTCQDMSKLVRHAIQSVVAAILSPFEMHAYTPRRGCRADDATPAALSDDDAASNLKISRRYHGIAALEALGIVNAVAGLAPGQGHLPG
eukprot:CAMPEP_0169088920 /NCGR_PEP_ID=MMETSP1015-20121227/15008_1 /TAXON_ID=342587 /ORGANISM="Karlodinium micrum, Strain CCMP2283" /LENGTH=114 /DNA_ID=CAMNT_0009149221 /DNA_START=403 /DNA_END=743 /DNA_ORIENTATION=-